MLIWLQLSSSSCCFWITASSRERAASSLLELSKQALSSCWAPALVSLSFSIVLSSKLKSSKLEISFSTEDSADCKRLHFAFRAVKSLGFIDAACARKDFSSLFLVPALSFCRACWRRPFRAVKTSFAFSARWLSSSRSLRSDLNRASSVALRDSSSLACRRRSCSLLCASIRSRPSEATHSFTSCSIVEGSGRIATSTSSGVGGSGFVRRRFVWTLMPPRPSFTGALMPRCRLLGAIWRTLRMLLSLLCRPARASAAP
mmetsp:Transcript_18975/g.45305  ORF Transcript_18975/g.45305 Transcript_18975/m.45305 type:complete len:259 (-) Transcript_18975:59-835(-)